MLSAVMASSVMLRRRRRVDRVDLVSVAVAVLPAASVVVTLACHGGVGIGQEVAAGNVDAEAAARDRARYR